ncbi:induced during hyphae development protein 1 isoform X3 [Drosophila yakuba]|nr:induced during hyphae development protein 1 isoform X3 [Drosophila yakuba]KRK06309.1 uncharacterized protein Dyak_GE16099, isoform C [Drosophila yakuba]
MHALYCTLCSPYYETRANYNGLLKAQKTRVNELEAKVSAAKLTYNEALKNLEQISEDIHRQRQQRNNLLNYEAMLRQVDAVDTLTAGLERSSCGTAADLETEAAAEEQEHADEEYLRMPERLGHHECPHLLTDFEAVLTFPQKLAGGMHKSASTGAAADGEAGLGPLGLHAPYEVKSGSGSLASGSASVSTSAGGAPADNDIEQWTEIRLSHSDSTSSSYSNQSLLEQQGLDSTGGMSGGLGLGLARNHLDADAQSQHSTSSSDEPKRKVTCTTIFQDDSSASSGGGQQMSRKQSLSQWLSRSNSFKGSGRRQSLDLLIDAGDKVKDVFSYGFQKVGRSLERRNSESEMSGDCAAEGDALLGGTTDSLALTGGGATGSAAGATGVGVGSSSGSGSGGGAGDFFLFSRSSEPKELLSDEQVENLLLNHLVDENGAIIVEELKSPTTTTTSMYHTHHHQQQQQQHQQQQQQNQQQKQQQKQHHQALNVVGALLF